MAILKLMAIQMDLMTVKQMVILMQMEKQMRMDLQMVMLMDC